MRSKFSIKHSLLLKKLIWKCGSVEKHVLCMHDLDPEPYICDYVFISIYMLTQMRPQLS